MSTGSIPTPTDPPSTSTHSTGSPSCCYSPSSTPAPHLTLLFSPPAQLLSLSVSFRSCSVPLFSALKQTCCPLCSCMFPASTINRTAFAGKIQFCQSVFRTAVETRVVPAGVHWSGCHIGVLFLVCCRLVAGYGFWSWLRWSAVRESG